MEQFTAEKSSNVGWARYDSETQVLEIDFRNSKGEKGSTYNYAGFPPEAWALFQAAESKGKHFAFTIRPCYKGVKNAQS